MAFGDRIGRSASRAASGAGKYTSKQISSNRKKAAVGALIGGGVGAVGLYALSNMGNSSSSSSGSSGSGTGAGADAGDGSGSGSGSGDGGDGDGTTTKKQVVEIPIDNYEDALKFALLEWNKIRRDDGRVVECSVMGAVNWKCGEWSKVLLPSYEINEYMYITRASHSNSNGDWTANITLVDYPPGWGEETLETTEEEDSEEEEDETSADEEDDTEDTEDTGDEE